MVKCQKKRSRFPQETKLLVLQYKHLFKVALNRLKSNPPADFPWEILKEIEDMLKNETSITCLNKCLKYPELRSTMQKMHRRGELLKLILTSRMDHNNLSRCLKFFNRLLILIFNVDLNVEGLWTTQLVTESEESSNYPS